MSDVVLPEVVYEGDVIASVRVHAPAEALVVGPDEVLVINYPINMTQHELEQHCETLRGVLGKDRFIVVAGRGTSIAKVQDPRDIKPTPALPRGTTRPATANGL